MLKGSHRGSGIGLIGSRAGRAKRCVDCGDELW
jgi:hypothetical protein